MSEVFMKRIFPFLLPTLVIGVFLLLAAVLPAPFGYWSGLAAVLFGPGIGIAWLLFPPETISLPERVFVTLLSGMFASTAMFAALNTLGIALTPLTISVAIFSITVITSVAGALRGMRLITATPPDQRPDWVVFGGGIVFAAAVTLLALQGMGVLASGMGT